MENSRRLTLSAKASRIRAPYCISAAGMLVRMLEGRLLESYWGWSPKSDTAVHCSSISRVGLLTRWLPDAAGWWKEGATEGR
jgi:hypothetical protein